jgi:predicted nucleotidyltransferase
VRLSPAEIQAIRRAVREVFGQAASVRVFGSRVHDHLRGGDLDLFVEVDPNQVSIAAEQRLRDRLAPALADLRTDIHLHERGRPLTAIERIAVRDGIVL